MKKNSRTAASVIAGSGEKKTGPAPERNAEEVVDENYLHRLEEENRRLKLAVADLTLRNQALKLVVEKKW